ncbi:MAG: type II/IV secretion system protein [Staphylococcus sp.]|jgi:type IV pilus assembly protein tapB|nr:type II/IV secretion system protein [Staphylococcus sp.]
MKNKIQQNMIQQICMQIVKMNVCSINEMNYILEKINVEEKPFNEFLIQEKIINEEQLSQVLASYFGYDYYNIDTICIDENLVKSLTYEFISKYKIIPLTFDDLNKRYIIASSNPFDFNAINIVYALFGMNAQIVVCPDTKLVRIKSRIFAKNEMNQTIATYNKQENLLEKENIVGMEEADLVNSPAVKLVDSCLNDAIAVGASDIHIEPYEDIVRIRYRIDGMLYENTAFSPKMYPAVSTRIKIISKLNIAERRIPQDGRITKIYNGETYDFRVSTLPTSFGEKIVIRILDTKSFNYDRSKLGFLPEENLIVDELLRKPYGIILLTGPTGCGKSTTLYSFIKEMNNESVNVITVEDPVEYTISGVNQVQVNNKANLTFASALRSILRQDPNIVMVGEIRDEETAEIAMRMAITGHLVLSTLHTNDAAGAVTRLIDLGLQPYFVTDALVGVISQRLIRRLCPECKKEYLSSRRENEILKINQSQKLYKAVGCPACHNTGYQGRIGVHEVLKMTEDLKELIINRASTKQIRQKALEDGMLDLYSTCRIVVLNGETTVQELLTIMYNK